LTSYARFDRIMQTCVIAIACSCVQYARLERYMQTCATAQAYCCVQYKPYVADSRLKSLNEPTSNVRRLH